jgi:hypothetical protein
MIVEKQMECRLAGETELLGENLPQRHFCPSQNPTTWPDPGLNPGRRGGKPATNRLSYGAAKVLRVPYTALKLTYSRPLMYWHSLYITPHGVHVQASLFIYLPTLNIVVNIRTYEYHTIKEKYPEVRLSSLVWCFLLFYMVCLVFPNLKSSSPHH